jgi:hypothetical protein
MAYTRRKPANVNLSATQAHAAAMAEEHGVDALLLELAEVANLRAMATKERSFMAAEKLLATERKIRDTIRGLRAEEQAQAARDDAVMESELVEALSSMPASQLEGALSRLPPGALENALARRAMH